MNFSDIPQMASHFNDSVYTQTFTPREYQVELLDTAKERNTIICCNNSGAKTFVAIKLLQELSWQMRNADGKRAIFILDKQNGPIMTSHIKYLTDLRVLNLVDYAITLEEWEEHIRNHEVIVTSVDACNMLLATEILNLDVFNLLVIDDCLYGERQKLLEPIMTKYKSLDISKSRVLGLAAGLFTSKLKLELLEFELQRLEKLLCSSVDTSSELVTLLQLCSRPYERLIECAKMVSLPLQNRLEEIVVKAKDFLLDHRFDPSEIYGEFIDELKLVPDPKQKPAELLESFLEILQDLGPWASNQAALTLLTLIEKLKIKIPYERHFLLLGLVSSVMVTIRALCETEFQNLSDYECIQKYTAPKALRFLEVIKKFKPSYPKPTNNVEEVVTSVPVNTKGRCKNSRNARRLQNSRAQQDDSLCAIVFVRNRFVAKVVYSLLYITSQCDDDLWWVSPLYSVEKIADPVNEAREAENEHRRQEEVLRRFRTHDCNIMVATSVLEQGCDLPKCNLVVHFDTPSTFHSYIQSKARARGNDSYYVLLVNEDERVPFVKQLAEYVEIEATLLKRCTGLEPGEDEERQADRLFRYAPVYRPLTLTDSPSVNFSTAIALVNRYCAKLPSDTFTRLTPLWSVVHTEHDGYTCTLRLPINSPLKQKIVGPSMTNRLLACRAAAYKTCIMLHQSGELDDQLQPIGKENFRANEENWKNVALEGEDELLSKENVEARPGTTKRRQYYYKRIADALTSCCPRSGRPTYFYRIVMTLTCPLPEEQNTRGRKIYPPEESSQGFGILTAKRIPKICAFPIFTRSGEVDVSLELCSTSLILTQAQIEKISEFLNYTFTSVLRLQRYLMLFDPKASENSFLIAPTCTDRDGNTSIDWNFLSLIYEKRNILPHIVPEEHRTDYKFDPIRYKDAVVMPWYRNQDQPQYFYVAEICSNLNPMSNFPGSEYDTFEEYYLRKYGIFIQNNTQHLLDVDHTSARLNFLTPRYVNRKGVALPTSSEETKKAKRENLEQKQILVPELCAIHPFPASLWRKAVCLPCILYRLNAFLLADEIRRTVALELGLGQIELDESFRWPALNFGWNLSNVLRKTKEPDGQETKRENAIEEKSTEENGDDESDADLCSSETKDWVEIGTWSNDMIDPEIGGNDSLVRYASPTSWMNVCYDYSSGSENSYSYDDDSDCGNGLRIEFMGDNTAEAVEEDVPINDINQMVIFEDAWDDMNADEESEQLVAKFHEACENNKRRLLSSNFMISKERSFEKFETVKGDTLESAIDSHIELDLRELEVERVKESLHVAPDRTQTVEEFARNNDHHYNLEFSFDEQPNLAEHPGPSPSVILQALTMSNANDGINLERLETIGDSFLKYAITNYLYSKYENVHEGKLSHLRSKQVSNLNLYRLGRSKAFGECMIATKFDPHDNWLPPCYYIPKKLEDALINACVPANYWSPAEVAATRDMTIDEICQMVKAHGEHLDIHSAIPYNLVTQHSIPDKSIADCVEALIGAYLIDCGPRGALLFMAWLGMRVLPQHEDGSYKELECPRTPLLRHVEDPEKVLDLLLNGYDRFEEKIGYKFRDRAYLLQALTHASYSPNTITDCYQRLEFLGDAVLDYLITRHLYEDKRMHSPGALTDLRSALVNNTIFASLAVRHGFHCYFRHLSPGLHEVVERFVRIQEESGHALVEELYLLAEYECEEVEDVEVPKALGDVFESVAGAIFLDSGMSLDAVWSVYYKMMKNEIERFSDHVPKSPIRELLEMEPETAKFGKPEKLADGRRVRVTVEVFGKGVFKGIGRNYRIAKCTAAKCALKHLKRRGLRP